MRTVILVVTAMLATTAAWAQAGSARPAPTGATVISLRDAVKAAVQANPNALAAQRGIDVARAKLRQAEVAENPTLSLQARYSYLSKPTLFGGMEVFARNTETNALVLTKPLLTWGRTQAAKEQARNGVAASTSQATAARDEVAAGAAQAYLQVLEAHDAIGVADQAVKALEAARDAAERMRQAGAAAKADVLRTQVELDRARENAVKARNAYQEALAALRNAMGLPQDAPIEVSSEGADVPLPAPDAKPARSDVAALEASVRAAEAGVLAAKRSNKPQLGAYADFQNIGAGAEFPRRDNTVNMALQLTLTVSDGGVTRAKVSEAEATLAQLREQLEAARQRVDMEVSQARLALSSAEARVAATSTQVQSAEESFRVLEVGYREGVNPLTDVLAAQAALEAARYARLAALYDVQIARVGLLRAMGLIGSTMISESPSAK